MEVRGGWGCDGWWRARGKPGTQLRARIWPAGDAEPQGWDADVTDSTISAAGVLHIRYVRNAGPSSVAVDDIVVTP